MRPARKPALYGDATTWGLVHADALDLLARLPASSVDVVVTDPPYFLDFHDEGWDGKDIRRAAGKRVSASEAFEGWTQTWASECLRVLKPGGHLLAFGATRTSHRLASGVENAGFEIRDVLLWLHAQGLPKSRRLAGGLASALKPAYEPILLARAPHDGALNTNLVQYGTGALNIDEARVADTQRQTGYWPAHLVLSHAPDCSDAVCVPECPAVLLDRAGPQTRPSRLFFCAKATRREREAGCEHLPQRSVQIFTGKHHPPRRVHNGHPTVKPLEVMRWLVRLVAPPGGLVLDPFTGSGTTGAAAVLEDRQFLGIEREAEYVRVARARLAYWSRQAARRSG